jgi:hypothetical protein
MDYLDTLRRNGWLADPSDQVRVVAIHAGGCPTHRRGGPCWCQPRLVLVADPPRRQAGRVDSDLPMLDAASNE